MLVTHSYGWWWSLVTFNQATWMNLLSPFLFSPLCMMVPWAEVLGRRNCHSKRWMVSHSELWKCQGCLLTFYSPAVHQSRGVPTLKIDCRHSEYMTTNWGPLGFLDASLYRIMVGESTVGSTDSYALERICAEAQWKMARFEIVRTLDFKFQQQHIEQICSKFSLTSSLHV